MYVYIYISIKHNCTFGNREISYMFRLKIKPSSGCVQKLKVKKNTTVFIKYSGLDLKPAISINIF